MSKPKSTAPWMPVKFNEIAPIAALQALKRAEATPDQQVLAMEFIIGSICEFNSISFFPGPDGDRVTAFAEGKRFVAKEIQMLAALNLAKIKEEMPK